jgi:phospholipase C
MPPPPGAIQHLVVLMLENRSFDHMLGFLKAPGYGIDGLNGDEWNFDSAGARVVVSPDAGHVGRRMHEAPLALGDVNTQIFGNRGGAGKAAMSGFMKAYAAETAAAESHSVMKCFAPSSIPVLATLAREYAVCDRWFASVPGPSLANRSFAHAATSIGRVDTEPIWFHQSKTIYELLAESNVESKIYFHDATMAMTFMNLMRKQQYFGRFEDFLEACDRGSLPAHSFIEPRYNTDDIHPAAANDQHPDHDANEGEMLIQQVYDAIRGNADLWNRTLLLIVYSQHGGFYDHVPPPMTINPDGITSKDPVFDFRRLGVRVPAVVVSPWIAAGRIDHTEYDHASIPATARKLFLGASLPGKSLWPGKSLSARDQVAAAFDRTLTLDAPRTDHVEVRAAGPLDPQPAARQLSEQAARGVSEFQKALVEQTHFVNQSLAPELRSSIMPDDIQNERDAARFHAEVMAKVIPPRCRKATN